MLLCKKEIGSDFMISSYNSTQEVDSSSSIISAWLAKLQEGKQSTAQIQAEMLEGVTDIIEEVQEKAKEKAEEAKEEENNEEAVTVSVQGKTVETSSEVPEAPEISTVEVQA